MLLCNTPGLRMLLVTPPTSQGKSSHYSSLHCLSPFLFAKILNVYKSRFFWLLQLIFIMHAIHPWYAPRLRFTAVHLCCFLLCSTPTNHQAMWSSCFSPLLLTLHYPISSFSYIIFVSPLLLTSLLFLCYTSMQLYHPFSSLLLPTSVCKSCF